MNAQRLWIIGTAIVAVAVLVLGWFVGVEPQLVAMRATDEQRRGVDAQNAATEATVARLETAFGGLDALEEDRDALRTSIPVTSESSLLLDQLDALAAASGTTVTQVTTSPLVAYTPPVVDVPPDSGAHEGDTEEAEEGAEEQPAPAEPTGPPMITDPLITPENFYSMQVSVAVTGSNEDVLDFVDRLQHGERLFLVTSLQVSSDEDTGSFTATSTGFAYVLLGAAGAEEAAAE
ncbi:hypothetical protein ELQ90_11840 [Labedella phragmitis]|uniref:Tfp pilus assembly protein PilO n=1 Tax=Labedella phragmitis TaxID=2498849 RepID=A0A444PS14_9MICO|nr:hypothetical protein [Labedella phragmitis]RWZ50029.1 hypothetical protein ELQ90_11840 [Labedella phragmitis]